MNNEVKRELNQILADIPRETRDAIARYLRRLAQGDEKPSYAEVGICQNLSNKFETIDCHHVVALCGHLWPNQYPCGSYPIAGPGEPSERMWDFRTKNGQRRRDFCLWCAALIQNGVKVEDGGK